MVKWKQKNQQNEEKGHKRGNYAIPAKAETCPTSVRLLMSFLSNYVSFTRGTNWVISRVWRWTIINH